MCSNTGNSYTRNWKKIANEQKEATQFMLMERPYVVLSTTEYYVNKVWKQNFVLHSCQYRKFKTKG